MSLNEELATGHIWASFQTYLARKSVGRLCFLYDGISNNDMRELSDIQSGETREICLVWLHSDIWNKIFPQKVIINTL